MFAFPGMLISAAERAGMKIPEDADNFDANEFPHFFVFCQVQLARPMRPGEHWENAKVIAEIPEENIRKVTFGELLALGLEYA